MTNLIAAAHGDTLAKVGWKVEGHFTALGYLPHMPVALIKPAPLTSLGFRFQKADSVVAKVRSDLLALTKQKEQAKAEPKPRAKVPVQQSPMKYFGTH